MATTWTRLKTWIAGEVLRASDLNAEFDRGVTTFNDALNNATGHDHDGSNSKKISYISLNDKPVDKNAFMIPVVGALTTGTDKGAVWPMAIETGGTISEVRAIVKTAPTDAAIIIDVETAPSPFSSWTSIWTPGNEVTIAAGAKAGSTTTINTAGLTKGNAIRVNIDQVGSTIAGADLMVAVIYQATL